MLSGALLLMAVAQAVVSPEVHADRTVTFRIRAPKAESVTVNLEGAKTQKLSKDENGVWSATTSPLEPDIYGYNLVVDGVAMLDPVNGAQKPNLIWPGNLVTVPGNQLWEIREVPHGVVHRHVYRSNVVGDDRDYYVYTPPNYASGREKLPLLLLHHGYSDTAIGWTEVGKANVILDNLIAEGKVKPMIVLMPLGYGFPNLARPGGSFPTRQQLAESFNKLGEAIFNEMIPQVEKEYRVSKRREDRAIAGLSMGGAQSLWFGLKNADRFAHIGAFSTGGLNMANAESDFPGLVANTTKGLKTFFLACGTEDGLIGYQRGLVKWLNAKNIHPTVKETPGGHVWMLWRRNLAEFAQMIFK